MPLTTFPNILPDRSSKRTKFNRILKADFGDGYGQTALDGLNTEVEEWDLSFKDYPAADVTTITDFLDARANNESFLWTAPGDLVEKKWKQLDEYETTFPGHETMTLKVTLKRVYV
jgi:phage-related protein